MISKIYVKINLRMIRKNYAADPEIGFLGKSISKSNGCATAMPTAWELSNFWRGSIHSTVRYQGKLLKRGRKFVFFLRILSPLLPIPSCFSGSG